MEERKNEKLMQTHCYTKYGNFFISTILRQSSAALNPHGEFYETFGWKLLDDGTKGEWIADYSGAHYQKSAIGQHNEVVRQLIETGEFKDITSN